MSDITAVSAANITKESIIEKIEDLKKDISIYSKQEDNNKKQQIDAVSNTLNILIRTLK